MQSEAETRGIDGLVNLVNKIRADSLVRAEAESRIKDFREVQTQSSEKWFEELTYCLLTAYSSAFIGQRCVDALIYERRLFFASQDDINLCLKMQGHRFADKRTEYILSARKHVKTLKQIIQNQPSVFAAREWLIENIKGFGMKEASHFLRNVGYLELAIIDRHILSNMKEYGLLDEDLLKNMNKRRYLRIERILKDVAQRVGLEVGEMDLYLWYNKTGKVMK